jgi:hypothetical protein
LSKALPTYHRKSDIAARYSVTERSVDLWVGRGLLAEPIKFGTSQQSRVRWTDEQVAELDRKLNRIRQKAQRDGAATA